LNCASVILAHNHPSGAESPSRADQILTRELQSALKLIDVQVLDHIIVAAGNSSSMASLGLL
jgi:DNA repair protein RadC